MLTTTEQTKETMQQELAASANTVCWAVMALYKRQTEDEKNAEVTQHDNGVGFNGCDAKFGTSLAKQIIKWQEEQRYPTPLTDKQINSARRMLNKYAAQLARVANEG